MKYFLIIALHLFLGLSILTIVSFKKQTIPPSQKPVTKNGFAVIELFTSEGCSSCPPADRVAADLQKEYPDNVFVLGFHVDYWDYIGWKDEFSSADFTKRQRLYAVQFGLQSIYTPQAVVNGREEFVGSDKSQLYKTVANELSSTSANSNITLNTGNVEKGNVWVNYTFNGKEKCLLNFALVQLNANSDVKRGENQGRQLKHINIVRDFKTVEPTSGKINLTVPANLSAKDVKVIAFAQERNTLKILSAASASL
ncbi:MAG TPA: DUF1223 domain-containing protein [Chitinophagaceae bacterium]|nr:DUF1223 domain-containing protein [Chitinophagaceae bacterium]